MVIAASMHGSLDTLASHALIPGAIYTREDLRTLFGITASSLNNGIFKPASLSSVWIFVTETKTADRTQYNDILKGDVLEMEGQTLGRTDHLIEKHVTLGLELLVFYRKKKYEHPGAGFTYEGCFLYQDHHGSTPTKFILHRDIGQSRAIPALEVELVSQGAFDPVDIVDARKRTWTNIVRRQGQKTFRSALLKAYETTCAITGCQVPALLEAAHIVPYQGAETNVVSNGLLLRADIHTLFDLGLLWIEPEGFLIGIADVLKTSEYAALAGKAINLPKLVGDQPSAKAIESHLNSLRISQP